VGFLNIVIILVLLLPSLAFSEPLVENQAAELATA